MLISFNCFSEYTCADPGIFVMGIQAWRKENSLDNVLFLFCFLVLSLFYSSQWGTNGFIAEIIILEGVQNFRGGGGTTLFRGVVQMLISLETHITCDFSGGGGWTPYPPSGSTHGKIGKGSYITITSL